MNLGENIYYYRSRSNLSQGDLANALDISRQSVSKWENNSATPELDKLIKMSDLFQISLDDLVFSDAKSAPTGISPLPVTYSLKNTVGLILFIFGLLGFLLSVFYGDHLRVGEEVGEIVSISVVLLSIAMLATYNFKALALCAVVNFLYSVMSIGILHISSAEIIPAKSGLPGHVGLELVLENSKRYREVYAELEQSEYIVIALPCHM